MKAFIKEVISTTLLALLLWGLIVGLGFMIGSFGGSIYVTFKLIARIIL